MSSPGKCSSFLHFSAKVERGFGIQCTYVLCIPYMCGHWKVERGFSIQCTYLICIPYMCGHWTGERGQRIGNLLCFPVAFPKVYIMIIPSESVLWYMYNVYTCTCILYIHVH